jgi:uncharacterized membrane protein/mono/diheme cytochrome c family protein
MPSNGSVSAGAYLRDAIRNHSIRVEELDMEFLDRFGRALFELHPTHTMLVHFPIALTTVALLFVVLARWRRSDALEKAAYYNLILAAIGSIVAGIAGVSDNISRYGGDAENAIVKIILAAALFVVTTIAAISRRRNPDILWRSPGSGLYIAAFVVSFALASALGFLGGVIVYGFPEAPAAVAEASMPAYTSTPVPTAPAPSHTPVPASTHTTAVTQTAPTYTNTPIPTEPAVPPANDTPAPAEPTSTETAIAISTDTPAPTEPASAEASFSASVLPILERHCVRCHGPSRASGGVRLDSHAQIMAGGKPIVAPGQAASSILVDVLATGAMPRGASRLPNADIEIIRAWVNAGAPDN